MKDTIGDELEKAAMTERVMTVLFSHHLVNGIYAWTTLPRGSGGTASRAILESDGRLSFEQGLDAPDEKALVDRRKHSRRMLMERSVFGASKAINPILVGGNAVDLKLDEDQQTEVTHTAPAEQSAIGLTEIEGRTWLITPEGKPFFAHGDHSCNEQESECRLRRVLKGLQRSRVHAYGVRLPGTAEEQHALCRRS